MKRRNKLNLFELNKMKRNGEPVAWITAYDLPLAYVSEQAGVDMILVGDSGGMVQLGHETTNPVTMDEMIILSKAARRGAPDTFIVGDMPQGSYEVSDAEAVHNALRFIKEAGCDGVQTGGWAVALHRVSRPSQTRASSSSDTGVLTPQSATSFGGYRVQGKTLESFDATMEDAFALQGAGGGGDST